MASEDAEAMAAPTIPNGGIKKIFSAMFIIAQIKPMHIKNLVFPVVIRVATLGPKKV